MVKITIQLFAGLKDIVGSDIIENFDQESISVAELRKHLEQNYEKLRPYLSGVAIAINEDYVLDDNIELHDGDSVALIPPIAGGEDPSFLVTKQTLQSSTVKKMVATPSSGAIVVFEGIVRNLHQGRKVLHLEYEAYNTMALKQLELVGNEVLSQFANREVHKIAIHHRIGMLEIGDISLLVAISATHRADAFEAANFAVDRVKETVPIWKKEYGENGTMWQEGISPKPVTE
ncbi:MAG: molybdenum cofactor biosynthesis protein MoaE [Dehalococcoidia bacterium]|nr:molybdenum cofactor biosynthesis protein MoaE [Dehalococcoidia bacterium]